jgi:hypothetical protein
MSIFYSTGDAADTSGYTSGDKIRMIYDGNTGEYGVQIQLINQSTATATKGKLVNPLDGGDNSFRYATTNSPDILGIVAESSIGKGSWGWVWIQGVAQVYIQSSASAGMFVRNTATGDASTAAGLATAEADPTSPFATDKHFQEVGHCIQGTSATGVALCVLHFN